MNDKDYKALNAPLAYRMAPRPLDEIVGQEPILGKGRLVRRLIECASST